MAIPQSLIDSDAALQAILDELVDKHGTRLEQVLQNAVGLIETNILERSRSGSMVGGASLAQANFDLQTLGALLQSSGYAQFQIDLQADYRAIIEQVTRERYQHLADVMPEIGGASARALRNALDSDLAEFQRIGVDLTRRLKGQLEQMAISPISTSAAARILSATTDTSLGQAKTLVNTGLASLQRRLHMDVANQLEADGIEVLFLYQGPNDDKTRHFCSRLAGKTLTREQLGSLDNGSGLSVVSSAGGWNCRHDIIPITRGLARSEDIPRATSSDIRGLTS